MLTELLSERLLAVVNHLLRGEEWARERLRRFAGRNLQLEIPPLTVCWTIDATGCFVLTGPAAAAGETGDAAPSENAEAARIALPADTPWRLLLQDSGGATLLNTARIEGPADFVDALGFVFRHLRWDAEADLAHLVGEIAAHRLIRHGRDLLAWHRHAFWSLARNLSAYAVEERPIVAGRRQMEELARDVGSVEAGMGRLERRVATLETARRHVTGRD